MPLAARPTGADRMSAKNIFNFEAKFEKGSDDDCWLWTANLVRGYGQFGLHGRMVYAHRVAYEMKYGLIPEGLYIDHLCRTRNCVNPSHMEPVTNRVNLLRGVGVAAMNARKTHCDRGHELSGENLIPYHMARGWRICRSCVNAKQRSRRSGEGKSD